MLSMYEPAELLTMWGKVNSPSAEQMIGYMIQNMVQLDNARKQEERIKLMQQQEIEQLVEKVKVIEEERDKFRDDVIDLKARCKLLEEQVSLRRKENGQE